MQDDTLQRECHWRTAGLTGRCPCRGWHATVVHGRVGIVWLDRCGPAQHILYFHFNSLSHRSKGLLSRIRLTAAPCEFQAPTKLTRQARSHRLCSIEHALSFPHLNMSHLRRSLCFGRHQIQRPAISLLPFGSKHWSCRLLCFRQPAPLKYGKLQKL